MARRVAGYCTDCGADVRNPIAHATTATHRKALYRRERSTMALESDGAAFARRMRVARSIDGGTDEQNSRAAAILGGYYGSVIVEDESDGAETYYPDADPFTPRRMVRSEPCPRCGREDWRSRRGREYHVRENQDCLRWRKPERHVYAMMT